MSRPQGGVQTLDRAFWIMEIIAQAQEPLSLKEITQKSELPKPTVYRLLASLEAWGYVDQGIDRNYQLGTKLLTYGGKVQERLKIPEIADPYLKKLNQRTTETVFLGILDRGRSLYIAKLDSHHSVRLASGVGSRNYLHCTSLGKCLLTGLTEEQIRTLVEEHGLPRQTPNTITDIDELIKEIQLVKSQGYAIDDGENEEGVRCVATPIKNHRNQVVAAVSISGPAQRIDHDYIHQELLPELRVATGKISTGLGFRE